MQETFLANIRKDDAIKIDRKVRERLGVNAPDLVRVTIETMEEK
jgi:hypothetical protein